MKLFEVTFVFDIHGMAIISPRHNGGSTPSTKPIRNQIQKCLAWIPDGCNTLDLAPLFRTPEGFDAKKITITQILTDLVPTVVPLPDNHKPVDTKLEIA